MVFLLTKANGDFRGIGIIEVLWKTVLGVINHRIGGVDHII